MHHRGQFVQVHAAQARLQIVDYPGRRDEKIPRDQGCTHPVLRRPFEPQVCRDRAAGAGLPADQVTARRRRLVDLVYGLLRDNFLRS